jgi:hypothetical protein
LSGLEIPNKNFNRREIKWALRSDNAEVAQYFTTLAPLDAIKLTSQMFDELRCSDFPAYMMDCMEAVDLVVEHDDDRREMIEQICLVIDKYSTVAKVVEVRRVNLAIATYFSLSHAAQVSRLLSDVHDGHEIDR